MALQNEVDNLHIEINRLLALERLVTSDLFKKMYVEDMLQYIVKRNLTALKECIRKSKNKELETKNIRELRLMASQLKIIGYSYMQKHELLKQIKEILKWNQI